MNTILTDKLKGVLSLISKYWILIQPIKIWFYQKNLTNVIDDFFVLVFYLNLP